MRNAQRQDGVESLNLTDDGFRQWHPAGIRIMARRSLSANHPVNLLLYSTLLDVIKSNKKKNSLHCVSHCSNSATPPPQKLKDVSNQVKGQKREREEKRVKEEISDRPFGTTLVRVLSFSKDTRSAATHTV